MAQDPMFRAFLVSQAESMRNELTDPTIGIDAIVEKCREITKIENRVKRIDNPFSRKKKEPVAEAA
jgi:hypothetical protein